MSETPADKALALVHEGWDHLKHERPLAAWASWRRALQIDPEQPAAKAALERLARAEDLPASARREYRFRPPVGEERRARWDAKLRGRDLSDLSIAADAFVELGAEDPTDSGAAYNAGLCLAWLGIAAPSATHFFRCSIDRLSDRDSEDAIQAAMLGEILRQSADFEPLVERTLDVNASITMTDIDDPRSIIESIGRVTTVRLLPSPVDPSVDPTRGELIVAEILDRPWPEPSENPPRLEELPRVTAVILASGRTLRFSSATGEIAQVAEMLGSLGIDHPEEVKSPLPLALLDAAAWVIRIPDWVEENDRRRLLRENVEDYYENIWINTHRIGERAGSSKNSPGEAPTDRFVRARLEAIIRLREEMAARPSARALYQGYPFDRLRHRLGLPPKDPASIEPIEIGFMNAAELDALDIDSLDDHALAEAYRSAAALDGNSIPVQYARVARFAVGLVTRRAEALRWLDLPELFRFVLVRDMISAAPTSLAEAIEMDEAFEQGRNLLNTGFEVGRDFVRKHDPDRAIEIFESVLRTVCSGARGPCSSKQFVTYAAAGVMVLGFHQFPDHARRLEEIARELASDASRPDLGSYLDNLLDKIRA